MREMVYPAMQPSPQMVDMQAQTVTLPLSTYLELCHKHRRNDKGDDYLMYVYKVKRCSKTCPHDWTECLYAHRQEKARRRDPRKFPYTGIACPDFKKGECFKGQNCEYAHGVFEFWLHPTRFRTKMCESGLLCTRRICFFAHTQEQLRTERVHHSLRWGRTAESLAMATPIAPPAVIASTSSAPLTDKEGANDSITNEVDARYSDFPHLGLIVDLVNW